MISLYKENIRFLTEHAVDPDMRRYAVVAEAPRHYIDIDHYGLYPYDSLPRTWKDAVGKYSLDSVNNNGIVPWWVQTMLLRLTAAFKENNQSKILKLSAEIGHYIADAHVPLHASSNHNGQLTNQKGIHAFWESRLPELLAEKEWNFFIGHADYIPSPGEYIWKRVLESAAAADTVLSLEKQLSASFPASRIYAFEERNGKLTRQYSEAYARKYNQLLQGMVERRMQEAIHSVASFWYTAWINAGQPDLKNLTNKEFTENDLIEFAELSKAWQQGALKGRPEN